MICTLYLQSSTEEGGHRYRDGDRRERREQRGGRHDPAGRQLRVDRRRRGGGPHHIRQPQEVNRLHAHLKHTRDHSLPPLHSTRHASRARHHHHPLHRSGHRHGTFAFLLTCLILFSNYIQLHKKLPSGAELYCHLH